MGARYNPSYTGLGELLRSAGMVAEMRRRAERVKTVAEAAAPVGDPRTDRHAGRYKASFRVESGADGGSRHDRAYGRVVNDAIEAFYVEWGTSRQEGRRVLGSALPAAQE
jgi:hypothetical protein